MVESVAEYDDNLLEKFFEDPDSITKEEMMSAIRKAVIDMSFSPVMCGSAFKNKGVQALLDAVCSYLPSPLDLPPITGSNPANDQEVVRKPCVSLESILVNLTLDHMYLIIGMKKRKEFHDLCKCIQINKIL